MQVVYCRLSTMLRFFHRMSRHGKLACVGILLLIWMLISWFAPPFSIKPNEKEELQQDIREFVKTIPNNVMPQVMPDEVKRETLPQLPPDVASTHRIASQEDLVYLSHYMRVNFTVVDNLQRDDIYNFVTVQINLVNDGPKPIDFVSWGLYMSFLRPPTDGENAFKHWTLKHIQGYLVSLQPLTSYPGLKPGDSVSFAIKTRPYMISHHEICPNWYVASPGLQPQILDKTKGEALEFVAPFTYPRQWKRTMDDSYNPYTPEKRLDTVQVKDIGSSGNLLIPTPKSVEQRDDNIILNDGWRITYSKQSLYNELEPLSKKLGFKLEEITTAKDHANHIYFSIDESFGEESYNLEVFPANRSVIITAGGKAGLFYATVTLQSIIADNKIPVVKIADGPRFKYRGLMLDVSRNFMPVAVILRLIDIMGSYKLNKLHLHLSDDEGWRLEIPGLKELTELGSQRCHDLSETKCIISQLGSGPFSDNSGSGYYSVHDYKKILQFAKDRHIEVIPELDMPGHCHAAIKAMELRHSRPSQDNDYRLIDPLDTSEYMSVQKFKQNAINPCIESTYRFVDHVISEITKMHEGIAPLKTFHFGGDEVPIGANENSTQCQNFLKANPGKKMKEHFIHRVAQICAKYGLGVQGWEDAFFQKRNDTYDRFPRSSFLNREVTANVWMKNERANALANDNYQVVYSFGSHLYLDHHQEPDPEEHGLYWAARFTDTRKIYEFVTGSINDNHFENAFGIPINMSACADCAPLQRKDNIKGIQAQLWTETVRTEAQMDQMLFPRLLAVAERAWHQPDWEPENGVVQEKRLEGWTRFANTIGYRELERLYQSGVTPYLPPAGARLLGNKLEVGSAFPGLVVQYSKDNGQTWTDVPRDFTMKASDELLLATRLRSTSNLRSRPVSFPHKFKFEELMPLNKTGELN